MAPIPSDDRSLCCSHGRFRTQSRWRNPTCFGNKFVRGALPRLAREVISTDIETDGQIWISDKQSHTLQMSAPCRLDENAVSSSAKVALSEIRHQIR